MKSEPRKSGWLCCALFAIALIGCGQGEEGGGFKSSNPVTQTLIKLRVVIAANAISEDLLHQVLELSRSRFIEVGVELQLAELWFDGPEPDEMLDIESFWKGRSYNYWKSRWNSPESEPLLTIVYTRPLISNGVTYYGGWSEGVCRPHGGFALIHTKPEHLLKNALADSHEKGHLLGAAHDQSLNPPSIMHPDAGAYLGEEETAAFLSKSREEIRRCVGSLERHSSVVESGQSPGINGHQADLW